MHDLDTLYDLCESVMEETEKASMKLEKAGEMSAGDIDYLDKLTHTLKSIKTVIAMEEAYDDDYSSDGRMSNGSSYERANSRSRNRSDRNGSSYARGRGRNAKRDSMGRYSRDGRMYDGYSRDDAKMEMMDNLREMEMDAKDEETRRMIQQWKRQIEQS